MSDLTSDERAQTIAYFIAENERLCAHAEKIRAASLALADIAERFITTDYYTPESPLAQLRHAIDAVREL